MKKVFVLFLAWCVLFQSSAVVVASAASEDMQKEQIVLLPIKGQGLTETELSFYRDAVAQGLSTDYLVKYGEQVDKVIEDIFAEESKSGLECDESRCYRDIATVLNVKLIAKATVIPRAPDYQISMVIYNVYENRSVMTKVDICKKCSVDQLLKRLVAMASAGAVKSNVSGTSAIAEKKAIPATEGEDGEEKGVRWYWYVLAVLAAGGAAAALGGGGGGGGGTSPSSPPPGTVHTSW